MDIGLTAAKPPPCRCPRYPFPHRRDWECVQAEWERDMRRDEANRIAAERDRINGTYGDNR